MMFYKLIRKNQISCLHKFSKKFNAHIDRLEQHIKEKTLIMQGFPPHPLDNFKWQIIGSER